VQVEEGTQVVSIDPDKALAYRSIVQQERYQIAKLSHVAAGVERSRPFADRCLGP
jgi:hypothetical protein